MSAERYNLIAVVGPTASGKTAFAVHLADALDGEIISADSRQVYRNMNIGTGKDYEDYRVNNRLIPVHLIDIAEPGHHYNLFEYQQDFYKAWTSIRSRQKMPILCGGSGLYIDAVTRNYKLMRVPENPYLREELKQRSLDELAEMLESMKALHNITDIDTKEHVIRALEIETFYKKHPETVPDIPVFNTLFIGIRFERSEERKRITERLYRRLKQGMIDEVRQLLETGLTPDELIYYGLEYKYITLYITGKLTYDEMAGKLNTAIHQFAKRQMTWFRKMERAGTIIHWIDGTLPVAEKLQQVLKLQDFGS